MGKNIVICCDGTNNQFGTVNTNVVKLCSTLVRDLSLQVVFYDPGVGTIGDQRLFTRVGAFISRLVGSAIGTGLRENLAEAYAFLCARYEPGDRVYMFGFSRGAYSVRALAGLIHMYGLSGPNTENLWPYLWGMYKKKTRDPNERFRVADAFQDTITSRAKIRFLGLWDTVSSVGWFWDPLVLPFTAKNRSVQTVRHAVAIDERRAFFRQNLWNEHANEPPDVKQCWFPGVHCDVGGGYPEADSGLSKSALQWMIDEAERNGLLVDHQRRDVILGVPPDPPTPHRGQAQLLPPTAKAFTPPDPNGPMHNSMNVLWALLEFLPRLRHTAKGGRRIGINLFRRRSMPAGACLHPSVVQRAGYHPPHLPTDATPCP